MEIIVIKRVQTDFGTFKLGEVMEILKNVSYIPLHFKYKGIRKKRMLLWMLKERALIEQGDGYIRGEKWQQLYDELNHIWEDNVINK